MFIDILLATLVSITLGMSWYGPIFGKQWMKYMKITPKQMRAAKKKGMPASAYIMMLVSAILPASIFSILVPQTILSAVFFAVLIWIGFYAPLQLGAVSWEGKPWGYFILNTGYSLVNLILIALIFAGLN